MFTLAHFIWLGIFAVVITASLILLKKYGVAPALVGKVSMVIAIIGKLVHLGLSMIASEDGGMVIDQTQLDFHLCSIQVYLFIAFHLSKSESVKRAIKGFMAPTMAIGALLALLIPTEGVDPALPRVWQYMIIHGNLVFYGFYLMLVERIDLSFKTYRRNLICMCGFAMLGFMMNSILAAYNANFLYLRKPPMEGLPVLNMDHGYFAYLFILLAIAVFLITAVHLPFMLKKRRKLQ